MIQCQPPDHSFPSEMLSAGGFEQPLSKPGASLLYDQLRNSGFQPSVPPPPPPETFRGWAGANGTDRVEHKMRISVLL